LGTASARPRARARTADPVQAPPWTPSRPPAALWPEATPSRCSAPTSATSRRCRCSWTRPSAPSPCARTSASSARTWRLRRLPPPCCNFRD
jgi:hypothetical protein